MHRRTFLVGLGAFAGAAPLFDPGRAIFDMGRWMGELPTGWQPGFPPEWLANGMPYFIRDPRESAFGYHILPPHGVDAVIANLPLLPGWTDPATQHHFEITRPRWLRDRHGLIHLRGQWGGLYDTRGNAVYIPGERV